MEEEEKKKDRCRTRSKRRRIRVRRRSREDGDGWHVNTTIKGLGADAQGTLGRGGTRKKVQRRAGT